MDVGGSMDPHAELGQPAVHGGGVAAAGSRSSAATTSTTASTTRCYEDAQFRQAGDHGGPARDGNRPRREAGVVVGDALMHPAELLDPSGAMYLAGSNRASGIE